MIHVGWETSGVEPACVNPWWAGGNGDLTQNTIQSKWNVSSHAPAPPDSRFLVPPYELINHPGWNT